MRTLWTTLASSALVGAMLAACTSTKVVAPPSAASSPPADDALWPKIGSLELPKGSLVGAERSAQRPECAAGNEAVLVSSELETEAAQRALRDIPLRPELAVSAVWGCATGCGPGFEYVARVRGCSRRIAYGCRIALEASCEARCADSQHRDHDGFECREGPEDAELHRAREREQGGQWAVLLARWNARMQEDERVLTELENAPRPWGDETMERWRALSFGSPWRELLHPLADRTHFEDTVTAAEKLADPTALREAKARSRALDKRTAALTIHADEHRGRHGFVYYTKDGRRAPEDLLAFDRFCLDECDRTRDLCLHYCEGGPQVTCDMCDRDAAACKASVTAFQRRRNAAHRYGTSFPKPGTCGFPSE